MNNFTPISMCIYIQISLGCKSEYCLAIKVNVPFTYIIKLFFNTLWYIPLPAAYLGFSFPHTLKLWCSRTFKFASLVDEKCFLLVSVCISLSTPDTEWHLYVSPRNCLLIASAHIFCSYHFLFFFFFKKAF